MLDQSMSDDENDRSRISPPHVDDRMDDSGHAPADIESMFAGYMQQENQASSSSSSSSSGRNRSDRGLIGKENIDSVFGRYVDNTENLSNQQADDPMVALNEHEHEHRDLTLQPNFGYPTAYKLTRSDSYRDCMDPGYGQGKPSDLGKHAHSPGGGVSPVTPAKKKREADALLFDEQCSASKVAGGGTPSANNRFFNDFNVNRMIGSGTFGCVQQATHKVSGVVYAVKRSKRAFVSKADRHAMLQEVETMAELSAESDDSEMSHIVMYYAGWIEDEHVYLQMELCETSIEAILGDYSTKFEQKEIYRVLRHVFLGLKFIHGRGLVHLDIKPGNILKKKDNYKISDFGLALHTNKGKACRAGSVEEGDSRYLAREMLDWEPVEDLTKCDIFAVGVMGFELAENKPIASHGDAWHILRKDRWVAPSGASDELVDILSETLKSNPKSRPTAEKCVASHRCLMSDIEKELYYQKLRVEALTAQLAAKPPKGVLKSHSVI